MSRNTRVRAWNSKYARLVITETKSTLTLWPFCWLPQVVLLESCFFSLLLYFVCSLTYLQQYAKQYKLIHRHKIHTDTHTTTTIALCLLLNKESSAVQWDAADKHTDFQVDTSHTYTAQPAPLVDYITVILTTAFTQSLCGCSYIQECVHKCEQVEGFFMSILWPHDYDAQRFSRTLSV